MLFELFVLQVAVGKRLEGCLKLFYQLEWVGIKVILIAGSVSVILVVVGAIVEIPQAPTIFCFCFALLGMVQNVLAHAIRVGRKEAIVWCCSLFCVAVIAACTLWYLREVSLGFALLLLGSGVLSLVFTDMMVLKLEK